jgi:hypothetical protein
MKKLIQLPFFCAAFTAFVQSNFPVIRATSTKVSIDDGSLLEERAWRLSPKARPDIFTAERTRKKKWVSFYTDIDSIGVRLKPGESSIL